MPAIIQICVVIVTIAIVALAYVAAGLMRRMDRLSLSLQAGLDRANQLIDDSRETSEKIRELLTVVEGTAHSVRTGVAEIEELVSRATQISSSVLDEVERPVQGAVAVVRGVRAGARYLMERLSRNGHQAERAFNRGGSHVGS